MSSGQGTQAAGPKCVMLIFLSTSLPQAYICTVVPHKLDCSVGGLTMHFLMRLCPAQIRMSSEQMCGVKERQRIEF